MVKNRGVSFTVYVGEEQKCAEELNPKQKEILEKLLQIIEWLHDYLKGTPLVVMNRTMGKNPIFIPRCYLYLSFQKKDLV